MIKYLIAKDVPDGYGGNLSEYKIIRKSELEHYLDNDWYIKKKITPIITPFVDWWRPISLSNKISVFNFILPLIVAIVFGVLSHRSNKKIESLTKDIDSLKTITLKLEKSDENFTEKIDILNKRLDTISLEVKDGTLSYKTRVDSLK